MAKNQKKTNQVILIGAVGLGAYALYKSVTDPNYNPFGEGSLGGTDELPAEYGDLSPYDSLPEHEKSWVGEIFDPNTIPEQPQDNIIPQDNISPQDSSTPTPNYDPTLNYTPFIGSFPTQTDPTPTQPTGLFGTGVTAPQWGLGLLGVTSTPFTNLPKNLLKQGDNVLDFSSIWKRASREAVEETPFVGKKLGEFAFDKADDVASVTLKRAGVNVGGEIVEAGAKGTLKRVGKEVAGLGVKAIPFVGIVAGSEFDVMVDDRPRWLAYPTNILGDVVGGIGAVLTSPASATGVGTAIPIAVGVGGQVATESLIYGAYDTITGKNKLTPEEQREVFIQTKQATNQGTIVDDEFWGQQYDNIVSPSNVGGSFNLAGSSKNVSYGSSTSNSSRSSNPFSSSVAPVSSSQSVFSSQVNTSKSTGGSSKPVSSPINIGSASNKSSSSSKSTSPTINTSRFVAQAGGGYSDTVAMQSVSKEVAQQRSTASNIFKVSSSSSSSSSRSSTPTSSSNRSGATTTTSKASTPQSSSSIFKSYSAPMSVAKTTTSSSAKTSTATNQTSSRNYSPAPKPQPKPQPKPAPKQSAFSKIKSWFRR